MWCADGPPSVREIPLMPTDHQELQAWISELRNALEFSDSATVAKVGSSLSGHSTARGRVAGRTHGGVDQIIVDGIVGRRVRREKEGGARGQRVGVAIHGGESSVRTCYGL